MNKNSQYLLLAVSSVLIIWLIYEINKKNKSLNNPELDRLRLLKSKIDTDKVFVPEIKTQLNKLIEDYKSINPKIAMELLSIFSLVELGEHSKAIFALAKSIEVVLSTKVEVTDKKQMKFEIYIAKAKDIGLLNQADFYFLNGLKELRNNEGHKAAEKFEDLEVSQAFITGVNILLKLTEKFKK